MSTDVGPTLYRERGSSWWPLLWAPGFVVAGMLFDLFVVRRNQAPMWLVGGALILGCVLLIVRSRRSVASLSVSPSMLRFGQETVAITEVVALDEVGASIGSRVLGGGWSVPRRTEEIPMRLRDGATVLGWATDPTAFRDAVRPLLETR